MSTSALPVPGELTLVLGAPVKGPHRLSVLQTKRVEKGQSSGTRKTDSATFYLKDQALLWGVLSAARSVRWAAPAGSSGMGMWSLRAHAHTRCDQEPTTLCSGDTPSSESTREAAEVAPPQALPPVVPDRVQSHVGSARAVTTGHLLPGWGVA